MKVEVFVDGKLIAESHPADYYQDSYNELRNNLCFALWHPLGKPMPSDESILMALDLVVRHNWSLERLKEEYWRR